MKLHIDNLDGNGFVDYTPALLASDPLTIQRVRGQRTTCIAGLDVSGNALPVPADRARVRVKSDTGSLLFSGYVTRTPLHPAAAELSSGKWQSARLEAAEDAWLRNTAADASLQPAGSALHPINLTEDAVKLQAPAAEALAMRAADVTVSGAVEATTYVTELFQGDGTTASFSLMDAPFREASAATLLADSFETGRFDERVWSLIDPGGYIGFGSAGLRVSGGNGFDGQTVLRASAMFEMGGTLTAELTEVQLKAGSDGVLLGMYSNIVTVPNCFAGFRVKGSAGAHTLIALVNGAECGTAFTFEPGHSYTLRLRLHCTEVQRVPGTWQVLANGGVQAFGHGGGAPLVEAPMQLVFEVQDPGLASNTVATVLYTGAVAASPAQCVFAPVNSVDMQCEAGSCRVRQQGSAWVVSTLPDGTVVPRREGAPESGADFSLSGNTLLFYSGRVPAANETVTVTYRRAQRSQARLQDQDALTVMANQGLPGLSSWSGTVHLPAPRSSADCRYAAQALLAFASDGATGVAGECTFATSSDTGNIQPGDRLLLPLRGGNPFLVPVKSVLLVDGNAMPEVLTCTVRFAQDRDSGLSFTVSDTIPDGVPVPAPLSEAPALSKLSGLQVVSIREAALQIDAGTDAPSGGGFEVRRRDNGFGSGDADTVLQSPVRSFSIPRAAFRERFYVRMYDGSLPPMYSEWSSIVVTHLPVS